MIFISEALAREQHADLLREAAKQRLVAEARRAAHHRGRMPGSLHERRAIRALRGLAGGSWVPRRRNTSLRRLEDAPLFRGLSRRDLALLARRADPVSFEEGAVLSREESPAAEFMVITSGIGEATLGDERIGILGPGDHFGELTLLEGEPHVPTVTALTDVEGFVFGRREFWGVLYAVPAVALRLTARLGENLRRAERRLAARPRESAARLVEIEAARRSIRLS